MKDEIMTSELRKVTAEIVTLTQQGQRMALGYAIEIGRRLVTAKGLVNHGEWGAYLKENVRYSERTAQNFMKLFEAYGADQIDFFGTSKTKTLADLTYTQALLLLALPEEEREEMAEEARKSDLSTRELEEAIREKNEARKAEEEAQRLAGELRERADEEMKRAAMLERELRELRERPVEVAVQEPDPEVIRAEAEKLASEATKELRGELDALRESSGEQLKGEKEKRRKLEDAVKAAKKESAATQERIAELSGELETAKKTVKEAEEKAEAAEKLASGAAESVGEITVLRKKLEMADPVVVEFRVHFKAVQEELRVCGELIEKAGEKGEKLRRAMATLLENAMEEMGPRETGDEERADTRTAPTEEGGEEDAEEE